MAHQPGTVLLQFFGDGSFGWYPPAVLQPFASKVAQYSKSSEVKKNKVYRRAIEEAQEVHDRRGGAQPATDHHPFDILDRSTWPGRYLVTVPFEPSVEQLQGCTAEDALRWIQEVALWQPEEAIEHLDLDIAKAAAGLCWMVSWSQRTLLSPALEEAMASSGPWETRQANTAGKTATSSKTTTAAAAAAAEPKATAGKAAAPAKPSKSATTSSSAVKEGTIEEKPSKASKPAKASKATTAADDAAAADATPSPAQGQSKAAGGAAPAPTPAGDAAGTGGSGKKRGRPPGSKNKTPAAKQRATGDKGAKKRAPSEAREEASSDEQPDERPTEDTHKPKKAAAKTDKTSKAHQPAAAPSKQPRASAEPEQQDDQAVPAARLLAYLYPLTDDTYMEEPGQEQQACAIPSEVETRYWGPCGAQQAAKKLTEEAAKDKLLYGGQLEVGFPDVLSWLHGLACAPEVAAREPSVLEGLTAAQEGVAVLRWREAVQARSGLHRFGEIGMLARSAMEALEPESEFITPCAKWPVPPPATAPPPLLTERLIGKAQLLGATGEDAPEQAGRAVAAGKTVGDAGRGKRGRPRGVAVGGRAGIKRSADDASDEEDTEMAQREREEEDATESEPQEEEEEEDEEEEEGGKRSTAAGRGKRGRQVEALKRWAAGRSHGRGTAAAGTVGPGPEAEADARESEGGGAEEEEEEAHRPVVKVEIDFKEYQDRVPSTEASFQAAFQRWQAERNQDCSDLPMIGPYKWRPFDIFQLVAAEGGWEAVRAAGRWHQVARAWQQHTSDARPPGAPAPKHVTPHSMVKALEHHYQRLLSKFEKYVSLKCPVHKELVDKHDDWGRPVLQDVAQPKSGSAPGAQGRGALPKKHKPLPASAAKGGGRYDLDDFDDLSASGPPLQGPTKTGAAKGSDADAQAVQTQAAKASQVLKAEDAAKVSGVKTEASKGMTGRSAQLAPSKVQLLPGPPPRPMPGAAPSLAPSSAQGRDGRGAYGGGPGGRPGYSGAAVRPVAGGTERAAGGVRAGPPTPSADPDMRRIMLRYPERTQMPSLPRAAFVLKTFIPQLKKEGVTINSQKCVITADCRTPAEAIDCMERLQPKLHTIFPEMRLERSAGISTILVRADEKPPPRPGGPGGPAFGGNGGGGPTFGGQRGAEMRGRSGAIQVPQSGGLPGAPSPTGGGLENLSLPSPTTVMAAQPVDPRRAADAPAPAPAPAAATIAAGPDVFMVAPVVNQPQMPFDPRRAAVGAAGRPQPLPQQQLPAPPPSLPQPAAWQPAPAPAHALPPPPSLLGMPQLPQQQLPPPPPPPIPGGGLMHLLTDANQAGRTPSGFVLPPGPLPGPGVAAAALPPPGAPIPSIQDSVAMGALANVLARLAGQSLGGAGGAPGGGAGPQAPAAPLPAAPAGLDTLLTQLLGQMQQHPHQG